MSLKILFLGELTIVSWNEINWKLTLKILHGSTVNKSTDTQCGAHACHWLTFVVLALLEKSNLEQRAGVPQGHTGRLEAAMVWMQMLPAMQETPSVLYSYPWSDDALALQGLQKPMCPTAWLVGVECDLYNVHLWATREIARLRSRLFV